MAEQDRILSPFDIAAYVRDMSQHLSRMCDEAGLVRVSAVLNAASYMAAEEMEALRRQGRAGNAAAEEAQ